MTPSQMVGCKAPDCRSLVHRELVVDGYCVRHSPRLNEQRQQQRDSEAKPAATLDRVTRGRRRRAA